MRAAAIALIKRQPEKIVVAGPVALEEACNELRKEVDRIIYGETPEPFGSIGKWSEDFSQIAEEEGQFLLKRDRKTFEQNKIDFISSVS